jgi:hypothetical protein
MDGMTKGIIVVDGANVAYAERSRDGEPKVSNMVAVQQELKRRGYEPIIIIDASLRYEIDDPDQLEGLLDRQAFRQAPAGTDADYFILRTAEQQEARIVSNDEYEQYQEDYPWIERRRVPFMIVEGQVQLYEKDLT